MADEMRGELAGHREQPETIRTVGDSDAALAEERRDRAAAEESAARV